MPEGPEIRRAADKVAAVLVGQKMERVAFGLQRLRPFERRLTGRVVTGVTTRGKALLTCFDNGLTIYSHNQLYGRWYTLRRPRFPKTSRQLRISRRSYRTGGITVAPGLASALKSGGMSYGQYRFYVFGREGLPCHRCDATVERRTMASRNLFYCPSCQAAGD